MSHELTWCHMHSHNVTWAHDSWHQTEKDLLFHAPSNFAMRLKHQRLLWPLDSVFTYSERFIGAPVSQHQPEVVPPHQPPGNPQADDLKWHQLLWAGEKESDNKVLSPREILRLEFTQLPKWSRCLNQDSIKGHFPGKESPLCVCPPPLSLRLRLPISCCCPPEHVSQ